MNTQDHDEPLSNHSPEIQEKLRALMMMHKHATTEGEANAALGRAQAIATKHQIDLARIQVVHRDPIKKENYVEITIPYGTKVYQPMEVKYIAWLLEEYYDVAVIWAERWDKEKAKAGLKHNVNLVLLVFGPESKVQFAQYAYDFLREVFPKLWRKAKSTRRMQMDQRRAYYYGVYQGMAVNLQREKEKAQKEGFEALPENERKDVQKGYELMVISAQEELKKEKKAKHPVLGKKKFKSGNIYDPEARSAGFHAGIKIQVNRPLPDSSRSKLQQD